jgi:glyoxylase-like metal-dependent hydrolase (beta-lactamase superfamily II)
MRCYGASQAPRCRLNARPGLIPEKSVPIASGVQRIVAGNAGMMTGPGTNTYVIGTGELTVLDPGPIDERHLAAILGEGAARSTGGRSAIRHILVTHTHRDHSPLAAELAQRTGAAIIGLPAPHDGRQDEHFVPSQVPQDGERLSLGGVAVTAIHTPGHASNCVCYLLERERLLFTGDHILQGVSPVILPPDGDMSAYFASLDKLEPLDFERIAPGHGEVMGDGKREVAALRAHRQQREDKVLRCLGQLGGATLDTLTPPVYDDVPADRHGWARLTLEAHLIKLKREGKVSEQQGSWSLTA